MGIFPYCYPRRTIHEDWILNGAADIPDALLHLSFLTQNKSDPEGLTPLELLAAILYARASVFCRVKE